MKPTLVLIACSERKLKVKTQAKSMYQDRLFKLSKKFAEKNGYDYQIISAKYGLLNPDDIIEPYEQTIQSKKDVEKLQRIVLPKLDITEYGRIIVLTGKKYREILEPNWDERFVFIKSKGYGDLCKQIAQKIPNSNETLIPYVEGGTVN